VIAIFAAGWLIGSGRLMLQPKSLNTSLPQDLDYATVEEVYDALKGSYDGQLTVDKLLDGLKEGLAEASGDAYTEYMNQEAATDFNDDLNGSFTGVGAELGKENDQIVIIAPIAGFPAEKAGIKAKDIITKIDGESASGLEITEAVKKIRGAKDTKVKLTVFRGGKELDFEIVRDTITIASVKTEILEGNIGYMQISRFAEDTAKLAREGAEKFKAANVKGVILDVRGDPGGLLDASVEVSSLWLPSDKVVLEEKRGGVTIRTYNATGDPILNGVKTVVLIDGGSASASEITAGALKDNGAATLMGEKSYGKGSVQQIRSLQDGGALKVTIARWFTPKGINIDKEGLKPDKEVKLSDEDIAAKNDVQKTAAIQALQ
jgi:carboxyl-terminal processing protease